MDSGVVDYKNYFALNYFAKTLSCRISELCRALLEVFQQAGTTVSEELLATDKQAGRSLYHEEVGVETSGLSDL